MIKHIQTHNGGRRHGLLLRGSKNVFYHASLMNRRSCKLFLPNNFRNKDALNYGRQHWYAAESYKLWRLVRWAGTTGFESLAYYHIT